VDTHAVAEAIMRRLLQEHKLDGVQRKRPHEECS
jgi:hypothetical protein